MKTSPGLSGLILAACVLASASFAQTAPVTLTVNTTSRGAAIPLDFSGLSFERGTLNFGNAGASGYIFSPTNTQLVTLFQNLSIKNLRVGGGSVDTESVVGTGNDGYLGVDNLFGFSKASGANVIYTVRLLNPASNPIPNLMADDAAAAGYIWSNYKANLINFAIGNEPDFFSYHNSDPLIFQTQPGRANAGTAFPSYLADWTNFANAMEAAAPGATFSGPDSGSYAPPIDYNGVPWTISFADAENGSANISDITQHLYVGGSPGTTTVQQAIDNMLSADWINGAGLAPGPEGTSTYTPYGWFYTNGLAGIANDNFPYRLTESNDYLTGINGASNAFSSALWALDYMHWWAGSNGAGVNFHNKQWIFTDTIVPSPNPCVGTCGNYQTSPKGYGIKAFDLGGHGYVEPVSIANPNNANVTAYAVGAGRDLYVTIINKTHSTTNDTTDAVVTIQPNGFQAASAASIVLTDGQPGNAALIPTTLGGATIPNNARWAGQWTPLSPDTNGSVAVTVQATTAAVVKIHAASNFAGPIEMNQNGALQIFATDANGNVSSDAQVAADVPNSDLTNWSGWANNMSGIVAQGHVAVANNENNTLEVFVPTNTGDVYHNFQSTPGGSWSGWSDLGGSGITSLQAANNADGSLSVFGIGANGDVWYASENAPEAGWSAWTDLAGQPIQPGFVVGQNLSGLLDVFGVDATGNVWMNTQTPSAGWGSWVQMSGVQLNPKLAVAQNLDGRLELFGIDSIGRVWHNSQQSPGGTWGGWSLILGHRLQPGFTVGQNANGTLEIFGVEQTGPPGSNNLSTGSSGLGAWTIAQLTPGGSWGNWLNLGGTVNPSLVVGNTQDGRIQLFTTGSNGDVWSDWQTSASGSTWSGWTDFGGNGLTF
ncbi:MAG TPA: hypothetical protein VH308_13635 [Terracidiphilus sp.]|nr:hypothetical protein [Terracidiphilus sp.]